MGENDQTRDMSQVERDFLAKHGDMFTQTPEGFWESLPLLPSSVSRPLGGDING
jgi:hypothetical protein